MASGQVSAKAEAKAIREHVARAKAYAGRLDMVKALDSLCGAMELYVDTKVVGREKFEITIHLDEGLRAFAAMPQMKSLFPSGITLQKGQEKKLLTQLTKVRDKIRGAIEQAEYEKMYAYKLSIDQALIAGQKLMEEGQKDQARLAFRKASEKFASEPGILQDIGSRLMRGGMTIEAVEYLEMAIKADPRDTRPYSHLVTALEILGEHEKAVAVTKEALKNFGPNDRTYTILARLHLALKQWGEAYDMASAALDLNPFARDAAKILEKTKGRIFSRAEAAGKTQPAAAKDGKAGKGDDEPPPEKKVYTFNI